jgi:hypothetical protein
LPAKTARRWMRWWRGAVWSSPFWREKQGRLLGHIGRDRLLCGVWAHFDQSIAGVQTNSVYILMRAVMIFFSPITHPPIYPF